MKKSFRTFLKLAAVCLIAAPAQNAFGDTVPLSESTIYDGSTETVRRSISSGTDGFLLADGVVVTFKNSAASSTSSSGGGAVTVGSNGTFLSAPQNSESDSKIVFSNNGAEGTTYSSGGAIYSAGTVNLRNAEFLQNIATTYNTSSSTAIYARGGAIFNDTTGTLILQNTIFENNNAFANSTGNNAWGQGGAIFNNAGSVTITDAKFSGNSATGSSTASGKFSYGYGGAIYNIAKGSVTISGSEFTGNFASATSTSYGGAIYNLGTLAISDSTFTGNYITCTHENRGSDGGAISSYNNAVLTVANSIFTGNYIDGTSSSGGAIYKYGAGQTDIANSTFTDNYVTGAIAWGGAVNLFGSWVVCTANIDAVSFDGNYAAAAGTSNVQAFGGAIYSTDFTANITNSTFTNNHVSYTADSTDARALGGAIYVWDGSVNITNNDGVDRVFSGNYAQTGDVTSAASGGFLFIQSGTVNFDIAANNTVTIGSATASDAAHDSIASASSSATITKKGDGTLVLNADNSGYQGTFDVTEGTLVVGQTAHAKLGGDVVIHDGATLCGIGELTGTTIVKEGGSLNPGNSPGTLTFENLTLEAGIIVNIETGDMLLVLGVLTLDAGGKFTVNFEDADASPGLFFSFGSIADSNGTDLLASGADLSDFIDVTGLSGGLSVDWRGSGFAVIPEPSTYALFAGLAALGFAVTRRRRK